ncbi:MAG: hypothetical protein K0S56_552 [Microvirga sp.]|jgi:hypothetical protein|nr:hypothetical protein [Microvirga sp.]
MTPSPYAQAGARLVDNGYHAIPVLPGSKRPGAYLNKEWFGTTEWQRFCDRLPTDYELPIWEQWPDAGVCIALDKNVKVIDIDTDDGELRAAVLAVLPDSPVMKRGAKGFSAFYRGSEAIVPRAFSITVDGKEERIVDLLAYGKQTILPPTLHPTTGRPYEWLSADTLLDTPPEQLPELPDNVAELIAAALEPFGLRAESHEPRAISRGEIEEGGSVWREINNLACENLDAWVPDLRLPLAKRLPDGRWRAVAEWRGVENPNLSFSRQGITDWGNGETFTPVSVVMRALVVEAPDALRWLQDRLGYVEPPLWGSIDFAAVVRNGLAKRGERVVTEEEVEAHVAEPEASAHAERVQAIVDRFPETIATLALPAVIAPTPTASGLPPGLCYPPGLVGDIAQWLHDTARNPSPTLNLGAALSLMGALAGRRYEGPTGLRTNVYVVGLAPSGFGKEHPRAATKALASACGVLAKFFGGEQIASSSALRNRVKKSPALVYMIDEFGGFLRKITNPRAGNHEREIGDDLLKFTGSAGSIFLGADYAQSLAEPIHNPNVCIYGTSTPETFWKALASGSIADGFLPRFIVLDAGTVRPEPRDAPNRTDAPPKQLVEKVQKFVVHKNGGNLNGMTSDGTTACVPIRAVWGEGAKRVFDLLVDQMFRAMEGAGELEPIYARVAENSMRLALIVAAGVEPERPVITVEVMQWAADVAHRSAFMLMDQAEERVADNDRQAEYKRVRAIIGDSKRKGTTRADVARRLKGVMDRTRMHSVIDQLVEAGEVVDVGVKSKDGRMVKRLWTPKNAPELGEELGEEREEKIA